MFEKILAFASICGKCKNEVEKIFKEEELFQILKFNYLINYI